MFLTKKKKKVKKGIAFLTKKKGIASSSALITLISTLLCAVVQRVPEF